MPRAHAGASDSIVALLSTVRPDRDPDRPQRDRASANDFPFEMRIWMALPMILPLAIPLAMLPLMMLLRGTGQVARRRCGGDHLLPRRC